MAAQTKIAGMTEKALKTWREVFYLFDSNDNGAVDTQELGHLMCSVGLPQTNEELEDLMIEMDVTSTGEIDFKEFLHVVSKHHEDHEQEMLKSWKELDTDKDGFVTSLEIKDMLESVGYRLAPWELRELVELADTDKDGLINFEEFKAAYGMPGWERLEDLGEQLQNLRGLWAVLDLDGSGRVDLREVLSLFRSCGMKICQAEAESILKDSDVDYDGMVGYQDFLVAYHSKKWKKFRDFDYVSKRLDCLRKKRDSLYRAWGGRERMDGFSGDKQLLMRRGVLYRHPEVKIAIAMLWNAFINFQAPDNDENGICRQLFDMYYTKIAHLVLGEEFDVEQVKAHAEVEWEALIGSQHKTHVPRTLTKRQQARIKSGESHPLVPKNHIGYSHFYHSLFMLADACEGRKGNISGEAYANYILNIFNSLLVQDTETGLWHWAVDDHVHPDLKIPRARVYDEEEIRARHLVMEDIEGFYLPRTQSSSSECSVPRENCEPHAVHLNQTGKIASYLCLLDQSWEAFPHGDPASPQTEEHRTEDIPGQKWWAKVLRKWNYLRIKKGKTIHEKEHKIYRRDFDAADINQDGVLDDAELFEILRKHLIVEPTEAQVFTVKKEILNSGSKSCMITFHDYMAWVHGRHWRVI